MAGNGNSAVASAFVVIAVALVALTLIGGCSGKSAADSSPPYETGEIAARVNGVNIYFDDVNMEYSSLTPEQRGIITKADALSFLIEREILYQTAVKEGFKAARDETDYEYRYYLIANNITESQLNVQLASVNSSMDEFMDMLGRQVLIDKLLYAKVPKQFVIRHEDAEAVYNASAFRAQGVTFEKVEKKIVDYITAQQQALQRQAYIESLKNKADVLIVAVPS